ncbi:SUF system Fe-S cluster assembly regulator [Francisella philomiragia]|uniref:FeS assembly SUF system regulator n=1 Tax=Francisella philomiragia TaxID=28110 RepID=A0AAW3DCG1_9GAMM|nr:SUF system Fe-S cluster assembly regulator [Francisella philomiragia]AJI57650.1 FeS assembly SUF system regulator [Francisella philomiragia]KFJ43491.1 FeS assembly SUF system regulator [Francisella philomiragia]MBK2026057.1 SUF system Fe-S cluster assembly regulator [Francisella philomiragia]MBK2106720.1 SUF system Fe-S cluster assembly regulator [Francisella philomiragia]MBK2255283.1 SUF system Fe-S cluster assembly regulator [Francisella philomiragia]
MLKISKLLDYGLLVVVTIAENNLNPYSAAKIAETTGLNIPTVRKLLNQLSISNIVVSKRGIEGGYTLVDDPQNITVLDVVKAVEKDVNLTECCDLHKKCSLGSCMVSSYWRVLNSQLLDLLSKTSIYDIVNNKGRS